MKAIARAKKDIAFPVYGDGFWPMLMWSRIYGKNTFLETKMQMGCLLDSNGPKLMAVDKFCQF